MKKQLLALSIAFVLSGCGEEVTPPTTPPAVVAPSPAAETKSPEQVQADAAKAVTEQTAEEQKELKEFLEAAKARDPQIVDAYYSVDAEGNKIINLVRNATPATENGDAKAAEAEKKPEDEGLGMLETVGLAMAGGMVGSMLANALVPNNPAPDHYQNNSAYYQRQTPEEAQRYRNQATANYSRFSMDSHINNQHRIGKSLSSPTHTLPSAAPQTTPASSPSTSNIGKSATTPSTIPSTTPSSTNRGKYTSSKQTFRKKR